MQVNRRAVVAGGAVLAGIASSSHASTRKSGGSKAEGKTLSVLQKYMEQHRSDWGLPGMTACVVDRDGFSGFVTSGLADIDKNIKVGPDHLFQIGSITKMMTALTVWSLIDEGKLSPDARLKDLMPGLVVKSGEAITLQHLLDHTSGIPSGAPMIMDDGLWTEFEPGTKWAYCNLGYRIAGKIAADADGCSFAESVEARVLRPLGMNNSLGAMRMEDRDRYAQGYQPSLMDRTVARPSPMRQSPWVEFDGPSGCIASTASDMALFLKFLLSLADKKGGAVLSDNAAAAFIGDPADAPPMGDGAKYGNGIAQLKIDERDYLHHTGGMVSFSSSLHVDREAGVAAFASSNVHYALKYRPRDVTLYACQLLRAAKEGLSAPSPKPTKPSIENPEQFAGRYSAESGDIFVVTAKGNSLSIQHNGPDIDLQPVGGTLFTCNDAAFAELGVIYEMKEDEIIRVWAGGVEYLQDPVKGFSPKPSTEHMALVGRYDNDDRWDLPVRVFAGNGMLAIKSVNYVNILTQNEDGDWVDEWGRFAKFDGVLNGKPQRLNLSGSLYYRRFG